MRSITLGTRGSELALTQARMTAAALRAAWPDLEIRQEIIRTTGDLRPDLRLAAFRSGDDPVQDKGVFTRELEDALRAGAIDVAVHSLKDVPTIPGEGFRISAVLPRAHVGDVLVSRRPGGLDGLAAGAVVATSSVRRARLLTHLRPDLRTTEIRGNVPTRLRKLAESPDLDALLLARAGLERLGLFRPVLETAGVPLHLTELDPAVFLPAASQGAIGLETWQESGELRAVLAAIDHEPTHLRIRAERKFLALLQAGCATPVGVHTSLENGVIHLAAIVFPEDGGPPLRAATTHDATRPEDAAAALFAALRPAT